MRILWLTTNRGGRVASLFDPLRRVVSSLVSVATVDAGVWKLKDVLASRPPTEIHLTPEEASRNYDLVFTDAVFAYLDPKWWNGLKIPTCVLMEDMHRQAADYLMYANGRLGVTNFMVRYRDAQKTLLPKLRGKTYWLPHCIDPATFKPSASPRRLQAGLISGSTSGRSYPLREKIVAETAAMAGITHVPRPPENDPNSQPRGAEYAKLLAGHSFAYATSSAYGYTVAKYFEIPACRTALVANFSRETADLGFVPGVNCIHLNDLALRTQADYWLDPINAEKLDQISYMGHRLVSEYHSTAQRAVEFVEIAQDIVEGTRG